MKNNILTVLSEARRALEALLEPQPHPEIISPDLPDLHEYVPEMVDLIAGGYEWICPACGEENKEIEATEHVTCPTCGKTFETFPPEHVYA